MTRSRILVISLLFGVLMALPATAQDLSKYRDFQFGMSLESVAKQIHMEASAAKTTHQRPAMIQTLQWDQPGYPEPAAKDRSLRSIRFDFYNGELFKIIVTYDPVETEGLTTEDMVEAVSAIYGRGDSIFGVPRQSESPGLLGGRTVLLQSFPFSLRKRIRTDCGFQETRPGGDRSET